jgi:hypothetical protein
MSLMFERNRDTTSFINTNWAKGGGSIVSEKKRKKKKNSFFIYVLVCNIDFMKIGATNALPMLKL